MYLKRVWNEWNGYTLKSPSKHPSQYFRGVGAVHDLEGELQVNCMQSRKKIVQSSRNLSLFSVPSQQHLVQISKGPGPCCLLGTASGPPQKTSQSAASCPGPPRTPPLPSCGPPQKTSQSAASCPGPPRAPALAILRPPQKTSQSAASCPGPPRAPPLPSCGQPQQTSKSAARARAQSLSPPMQKCGRLSHKEWWIHDWGLILITLTGIKIWNALNLSYFKTFLLHFQTCPSVRTRRGR